MVLGARIGFIVDRCSCPNIRSGSRPGVDPMEGANRDHDSDVDLSSTTARTHSNGVQVGNAEDKLERNAGLD